MVVYAENTMQCNKIGLPLLKDCVSISKFVNNQILLLLFWVAVSPV